MEGKLVTQPREGKVLKHLHGTNRISSAHAEELSMAAEKPSDISTTSPEKASAGCKIEKMQYATQDVEKGTAYGTFDSAQKASTKSRTVETKSIFVAFLASFFVVGLLTLVSIAGVSIFWY